MSVSERLRVVRQGLDDAARAAGRAPEGVRLLAVSKGHPAAAVREAFAAGQVDFGENYLQELEAKADALADLQVRWHFIGRVQANKAKRVARRVVLVHAVDSVAHASALARPDDPLPMLLAVNVAGQDTKAGVAVEHALVVAAAIVGVVGVRLRGLMTMPPFEDDPSRSRPHYERLAGFAAEGRRRGLPLEELSMGMSHDHREAVAAGATWVRVGTAIFGDRPARSG